MKLTYIIWGIVGVVAILLIIWMIVKKATKKDSGDKKPDLKVDSESQE